MTGSLLLLWVRLPKDRPDKKWVRGPQARPDQ